jgi:hypothetical protein
MIKNRRFTTDLDFSPNTDIVLSENRLSDMIIDKFTKDAFERGGSKYCEEITLDCDRKKFREYIEKTDVISVMHEIDTDVDLYVYGDNSEEIFCIIKAVCSDSLITLNVNYSNRGYGTGAIAAIKSHFSVPNSYIRWIYDTQYLESIKIPLENKNMPFTEMYPFLNGETLDEYYDRYMNSDASILLLLGPPGLGKTAMIRGLLRYANQSAILTYHTKLLESDEFFASWFRSKDENIVIMEDSDTMLLPRADGNSMMNRFLNLGDGLITLKNKKMIFTTNLPNVSSIDEALLRKGRCHDVVEFSYLNKDQASLIADKAGICFVADQEKYTIADIFADTRTNKVSSVKRHQQFGFM